MPRAVLMKIVGLVAGDPTPHDGRFVKEYDPTNSWLDQGLRVFHLVTTDDEKEAHVYANLTELRDAWATSIGTRPDGKLDRPLTAFSIEVVTARYQEPPVQQLIDKLAGADIDEFDIDVDTPGVTARSWPEGTSFERGLATEHDARAQWTGDGKPTVAWLEGFVMGILWVGEKPKPCGSRYACCEEPCGATECPAQWGGDAYAKPDDDDHPSLTDSERNPDINEPR